MQHVVTEPAAPFTVLNDALQVHQVPLWQDNLGWIAVCTQSGVCGVIDGPTAGPVLDYIAAQGWTLQVVLNTHTHPDHVGINRDLDKRGLLAALDVYGPASRPQDVPGISHPVGHGDTVTIGEVSGHVLLTEGHIDGHVSFVFGDALFCGDTMFAGGCGYLFDGPPSKMHDSLQALAKLPTTTRVCCAHEYTEDNLKFALSVEPGNAALVERVAQVTAIRANGGCTVPSTIADELATNPFVRVRSAELRAQVAAQTGIAADCDDVRMFAATRQLKDSKRYRSS